MMPAIVVASLGLVLALLFAWSFRRLPKARWQILATVPVNALADGTWSGVNLTYYGLFSGLGAALGVGVMIFMSGTVGLPLWFPALCMVGVLLVCLPAARIVNFLVEGRRYGFTVGGASFAGIVAGPWIILGISGIASVEQPAWSVSAVLAAAASAYAFGEGIGRLGCISFGCCYGKTIKDSPAWLRVMLRGWSFAFEGKLKKACYAHGLEHQPLVPVQGITAIVLCGAGLTGMYLFLIGSYTTSYVATIVITQLWRFASEFFRADYRGEQRISAYQIMALVAVVYTFAVGFFWPRATSHLPVMSTGWTMLQTAWSLLVIQAAGLTVFFYMGTSTATSAHLSFDLVKGRG